MILLDWILVRRLEGKTLLTPKRKEPFTVHKVSDTTVHIRSQHGVEHSYSRERTIKPSYYVRCQGKEINAKSLNEAGISKKKSGFSYLPDVIEAIYETAQAGKK